MGIPALQQRGFTLIEILITLVVLIFGVYAMLRIFPRGFSTIEVSQQRTIAAQLAEAELTRWKVNPENLPDAIVATDYDGTLIEGAVIGTVDGVGELNAYGAAATVMPGSTNYIPLSLPTGSVNLANLDFYSKALVYRPLDLTPTQFDGALAARFGGTTGRRPSTLHPGWQPNSLYLPRTVIGERLDIKRLGRTTSDANNPAGVPFYLLSHAPLDVLRYEGTSSSYTSVYVQVYDAQAWTYIPSAAAGILTVRQFTFDSSTGTLRVGPEALPLPDYQRQFKVDYTNPATRQRILGLTVTVPASANSVVVAALIGIDPDTLVVHEQLVPITTAQYNSGWLSDTSATARRNIYYVDVSTTITGKIQFPLVLQVDPEPTDVSVVKVDYRVKDWSILTVDVEVPSNGVVRLSTGAIKGPSYTNLPRQPRPQEVARNIKPGYSENDPLSFAYVVAVDRQSGETLYDQENAWPVTAAARRRCFLTDYRNGLLRFNYDMRTVYAPDTDVDTPNRSGRTFRIFYRGTADWAVQLMVTPRVYNRSSLPSASAPVPSTEGFTPTYAWRTDKNRNQVYFPLSEAGQTVAIDYYLEHRTTHQRVFIEGEIHTIGPARVTDLGQWVCPMKEEMFSDKTLVQTYPKAQWQVSDWGPISVRGLGVRARTVWVNTGNATTIQDLVAAIVGNTQAKPSLRESWRQEVIETYLTRAPI
jgi:hypothetical protein